MADLIDRTEVLKLIKYYIKEDATTAALLYQSVKQMPSAQPMVGRRDAVEEGGRK